MVKSSINKIVRIISLLALTPLLSYPLLWCPYRLPYLYCLICPLRCGWGRMRGFIILGILLLNLRRDLYCSLLCPGGIIQDLQHKVRLKKFKLPKWTIHLKYIILGLFIVIILGCVRYPSLLILRRWILYLICLAFLISFFSHRFWCSNFCPVRVLSYIIRIIRRKLAI